MLLFDYYVHIKKSANQIARHAHWAAARESGNYYRVGCSVARSAAHDRTLK